MNMKRTKEIALAVFAFVLVLSLISSCTSTHKARKCDGRRAIQTHMGPM